MTEVQSRPAATRGRQSGRGGRGGIAARGGGRAGSRANGDSKPDPDSSLPTLEDEGEIAELKQQYGSKVDTIKEMFPDWTSVDILFALQETDGDESLAVTRMAEGELNTFFAFFFCHLVDIFYFLDAVLSVAPSIVRSYDCGPMLTTIELL
jgi:hypothetical protein